MEEKKCILQGHRLHLKFEVLNNERINYLEDVSPEHLISGFVLCQVKVNVTRLRNISVSNCSDYHGSVFIRFINALQHDNLTYALQCSSNEFDMKGVTFLSDNKSWRQLHKYSQLKWENNNPFIFSFALTVQLDLPSSTGTLASLFDDTNLTDFELRGEDGSVHMHKAILAGYSPMLRSLVAGDWRESKEGKVQVPGTTKETLQHLKEYMYLKKLPKTGLLNILALASYYMMEDLEQKCSVVLLDTLSPENVFELMEFATRNKNKHLFLAIMENVQRGNIKVEDIDRVMSSADE